ncbi:PREDICTED: dr1-associated corepressor isoform X3 [Ceratotherium simum simum]|uniref:Dr1-associated corepressor isoform X3 n=1 Tax=Ceratotherium simum simum TaxID=73337 RepID=A0ABM1D9N8_CERSS|nr:PREDICTED: dr1-associated corepressor isoform X3 [Ceratotherium simum simum]
MPSKKKKYNARFPPARIKKIMQTDEEIGKVAAAVPVIISRALELFLESLLKKACQVTQSRNAKTMTTSHLKQCIELEQQFDFLKDLVASVPDMQGDGEDNHMDGDKGARRWGPRASAQVEKAKATRVGGGWGVMNGGGDLWADGLYLLEGAGSQAAVAGRMVGWEAKARIRSCRGQTRSRRMSLRTQTPMGKRRHRRPHPRPATPLPTYRAPRHPSCPLPQLCLCPQCPQAPQHLMQRMKRIMTPSALCPPGHTPF